MINSFTANPAQLSAANNCTVLQWQITGQGLAAVWLSRNGERIAGPDVQSGYRDCVAVKDAGKTQVYELKADTEFGWLGYPAVVGAVPESARITAAELAGFPDTMAWEASRVRRFGHLAVLVLQYQLRRARRPTLWSPAVGGARVRPRLWRLC